MDLFDDLFDVQHLDLFVGQQMDLFDGQQMDALGRGYSSSHDDCWPELQCYCCNNIQQLF